MISFVWAPGALMVAGAGGSETYTAGHVRELLRRGIAAQVVTVGHGTRDGRKDFPGVPFLALANQDQISDLPGTVIFVERAYPVKTRNKAAIIFHSILPPLHERAARRADVIDKTIIATSIYNGQQWAVFLNIPYSRLHIVLPFADPIFGNVVRPKPTRKTRVTFAGRLHPDKGIYTLLEMMHRPEMQHNGYVVNLVTAGQHVEIGQDIARMLKGYPYAKLLPPQKTIMSMAELLTRSDILLMPSVFAEPFGMLSIEAQHAGCRVVASNIGGLPETNCGLLTLVEPRDPQALLTGIEQAVALGTATAKERKKASEMFTLNQSASELLSVLRIQPTV